MQLLDADVVQDLVVAALEKGRVDRHDRNPALGRHAGGEGDRVLLGDADVVGAVRQLARQLVDAGAAAHRRGDADDLGVFLGQPDQRLGEHVGVARDRPLFLLPLAGEDVERRHAVILDRLFFRRRVALALAGNHVDQRRVLDLLDVVESLDHLGQVVAVDRPDVLEAQRLEEKARRHQAEEGFLQLARDVVEIFSDLGERAHEHAQVVLQPDREIGGQLLAQKRREGADARIDEDLVVVQDHDQVFAQMAGLVEAFESEARAHAAVADHRHHLVVLAAERFRRDHAEGGGDRSPRVARAEDVVFALVAAQKAAEAAELPDGRELLAPAAEELVRVRLVAGVPDDAVARRVEGVVQRQRQLHRAEGRGQMAADFGDDGDNLVADLLGELGQLLHRELPQVCGVMDRVEQFGHGITAFRRSAFSVQL